MTQDAQALETQGETSPLIKKTPLVPSEKSIQAALNLLRAVLKVVRDRSFYPQNHPQILGGMDKLGTLLENLFVERNERIFVFIDGQVYIDDLLSGDESDVSKIAQLFCDKKVEALSLRRGLPLSEFRLLVDHLANPEDCPPETAPFQALHIGIGTLMVRENGEKQIIPLFKKLGLKLPGQGENTAQFSDEIDLMREIYSDEETMKSSLLSNLGNVMHRLETCLFKEIHIVIPLAGLRSFEDYIYVHAINLCLLSMAQAEALGYSREVIHAVGMGALLHDIGETQTGFKKKRNEWKLSDAEVDQIKRHPAQGAALLLAFPEIPRVSALIVYEHHLKYDGTGYPEMMFKRSQHIASRLVTISDQFDAMRSSRPDQAALQPEQILTVMEGEKGRGLDPHLFEQFRTLIKSRKIV